MAVTLKNLTIFIIANCIFKVAFTQNTGKIIEQITLASNILNKEVKYTIYLPPDYTYCGQNLSCCLSSSRLY